MNKRGEQDVADQRPAAVGQTPSLPEEYVLYFDVPNEPEKMYWVMLDTKTKHFLYWGHEKQKK